MACSSEWPVARQLHTVVCKCVSVCLCGWCVWPLRVQNTARGRTRQMWEPVLWQEPPSQPPWCQHRPPCVTRGWPHSVPLCLCAWKCWASPSACAFRGYEEFGKPRHPEVHRTKETQWTDRTEVDLWICLHVTVLHVHVSVWFHTCTWAMWEAGKVNCMCDIITSVQYVHLKQEVTSASCRLEDKVIFLHLYSQDVYLFRGVTSLSA